jgi:photosystem II stability/assembly factor-like uncharacterized protein
MTTAARVLFRANQNKRFQSPGEDLMRQLVAVMMLCALCAGSVQAEKKKVAEAEEPEPLLNAELLSGLKLREIGPALASGRVSDLAVHPEDSDTWYVTVASGGIWKTINAGTTWTPIFDNEGSYSIGCITLDPNDPEIIWVGTGENNSQRSVSYGDGVYKSIDGGTSWTNMGLEESEHIGRIVVDPRDSEVVYVAAQGPLWRAGGDRGLYKTVDGGKTWEKSLEISEHTGANEVWMDPRDPDVLYASTYQRRRRTWTLIDGGPESAIYKTSDAGANWKKLENGLPEADMGKIGLAVSPVDPDVVYAIIESIDDEGGFFRSVDGGENWKKQSDYVSGSPQYYNELIPDPINVDRVYSNDTYLHVSDNGGEVFSRIPEESKHVDNHALWIDPEDTDHLIAGCDGGVYETWDRGETWDFKANLPITQFYKIAIDSDLPFYNVYGGTQDNFTLGGPSRTASEHGITNRDWYVTRGGDGFDPVVDPGNPDIVYSQAQYGELVQPQPEPDEAPARWNWDSALMISPHSATRLYFASQRIYRSDDRGDNWTPVSGDLTRNLDRNQLEVMGKVWSVDTVAKNKSTSFFGTIVALSESSLVEGLLYAGTDDGLVQVSEDGGANWRKTDSFPGVPDMAYVHDLEASLHDADTVFVTIDNHKSGDFKPYVLKSTDRGLTWRSIAGDLPERGSVYTIVQDHVDEDLLFVGTEFGVFTSVTGGGTWLRLKGGVPVIAVRDLEIQRREDDLVVGTFGRGIFILDDYAPLRRMSEEGFDEEALLFPLRSARMFHKSRELGYPKKSFQGDSFFSAANPPDGAVFTYYLKDGFKSLEDRRREVEKEKAEKEEAIGYPSWEELRAEDRAEDPAVVLTVRDADGQVVRRLTGPTEKGLHRVSWDLRFPSATPVRLEEPEESRYSPPRGPMVAPGRYTVSLEKWAGAELTQLADPQAFETVPIGTALLPAADKKAALAFQQKTARLQRAVLGATRAIEETRERIDHLRKAALDTPAGDPAWLDRLEKIETRIDDLDIELTGDRTVSSRNEPVPPSIRDRVQRVVSSQWGVSSAPTGTQKRAYEIAAEAFAPVLEGLRETVERDLADLEAEMEAAGAPWTPGRIPSWMRE